ncbi:protein-tyrosine phosphatase-like protein [Dichotomocladium elegans]|nr:protein-tyrosine phosphatase-like protein [Dichotomocladium elegans]
MGFIGRTSSCDLGVMNSAILEENQPADLLADQFQQQASLRNRQKMISAQQLEKLLQSPTTAPSSLPLLIDVRHGDDYEKARIRHSLNVSLPSLLVKRYQRGAISNFSLESFIATDEGKDYYKDWQGSMVVVYDYHDARSDHAAMLLNVLNHNNARVVGVEGGFEAIWAQNPWASYLIGRSSLPTMQASRSATTFSPMAPPASNVQRRSSLFSLDTSRLSHINSHIKTARPRTNIVGKQQQHPLQRDLSTLNTITSSSSNSSSSTNSSTSSCSDSGNFFISEIIPEFLYLGPEISTEDQFKKLLSYSIRRILNMAEECDDDVPGLREMIQYYKLGARDTVEMENIEQTLRQAVSIIDNAKLSHEPIYVHCKAGKSRSVAAILAYLVVTEGWSLKRAYQHVIKARPSMSPNIGFVAELLKLEESIHGHASNFATADWQSVDPAMPSSPDSQQAIRKVRMAWSSS